MDAYTLIKAMQEMDYYLRYLNDCHLAGLYVNRWARKSIRDFLLEANTITELAGMEEKLHWAMCHAD